MECVGGFTPIRAATTHAGTESMPVFSSLAGSTASKSSARATVATVATMSVYNAVRHVTATGLAKHQGSHLGRTERPWPPSLTAPYQEGPPWAQLQLAHLAHARSPHCSKRVAQSSTMATTASPSCLNHAAPLMRMLATWFLHFPRDPC